jgi:hypothetical protein
MIGANTRLTRPKATDIASGVLDAFIGEFSTSFPSAITVPVVFSVVIAFFQKLASHHGS